MDFKKLKGIDLKSFYFINWKIIFKNFPWEASKYMRTRCMKKFKTPFCVQNFWKFAHGVFLQGSMTEQNLTLFAWKKKNKVTEVGANSPVWAGFSNPDIGINCYWWIILAAHQKPGNFLTDLTELAISIHPLMLSSSPSTPFQKLMASFKPYCMSSAVLIVWLSCTDDTNIEEISSSRAFKPK